MLRAVLCDSLMIHRWSVDQPVPRFYTELAHTHSHNSLSSSSAMELRTFDVGTWERMNISVSEMHLQVESNIVINFENNIPLVFCRFYTKIHGFGFGT
jgi:hypothetical protein